jgi:hypothetical protein
MPTVQSDADAFLVAIPMLVFLLIACFRLDELLSRPQKRPDHGRRLCNWDKNGAPIFTDPGWTVHTIARRKYSEGRRVNSKTDC